MLVFPAEKMKASYGWSEAEVKLYPYMHLIGKQAENV